MGCRGAQDCLGTLGGISASFVKRRGDKGTVPGKGGEMTFFFFFFKFIYFNRRLITLQYCSGFCHEVTFLKPQLGARHQAEHVHTHQIILSSQDP